MSTGTVVEMPEDLDLPFADQAQSEDPEVCDALADGDEPQEVSEVADAAEVTEADVVEEQPELIVKAAIDEIPPVTPPASQPASEMVNLVELITDAEYDCRAAEQSVNDLKDQLKEAKKHYDDCVKRLRTFAGKLNQKPRPASEQVIATPATDTATECEPEHPAVEDKASQSPDAWRSVSLADIGVASIKGLGTKKYEALIELCPTLGDFEGLRSRVGKDAASLPDLMPKGIGQSMCDQLEEMVLDWLAKHQQARVAASDVQKDVVFETTSRERAKEINTGEPGCLESKHDKQIWESGYRACDDGAAMWECPWTAGDNQDDWIRGWLSKDTERGNEQATNTEIAEIAEVAVDDIDSL